MPGRIDFPKFPMPELAAMRHTRNLASGDSCFEALTKVMNELSELASEDHFTVAETKDGLRINNIRYMEPHTFILSGIDQNGHEAHDVVHYSQMNIRITKIPKETGGEKIFGFRVERC